MASSSIWVIRRDFVWARVKFSDCSNSSAKIFLKLLESVSLPAWITMSLLTFFQGFLGGDTCLGIFASSLRSSCFQEVLLGFRGCFFVCVSLGETFFCLSASIMNDRDEDRWSTVDMDWSFVDHPAHFGGVDWDSRGGVSLVSGEQVRDKEESRFRSFCEGLENFFGSMEGGRLTIGIMSWFGPAKNEDIFFSESG